MNILLINQGKSNENLGDKSIALTLKKILEDKGTVVTMAGYTQMEETSIPANSELTNEKYTLIALLKNILKRKLPNKIVYHLKYKSKIDLEFKHALRDNKKYDLVIIGGGQLIKTKSVFPYALNQWVNLIKKTMNVPIYIIGVGVDPNLSSNERRILTKTFCKIDKVFVRDKLSMSTLNKLDQELEVNYIPDVVLGSYQNNFYENRKRFLVNVFSRNSYNNNNNLELSENEYYDMWVNIINREKNNLKLTLAYTTTTDKMETLRFAKYLKKNTNVNVK